MASTLIEPASLEVSGVVSSTTKTFQLRGQAREPPPSRPQLRPQPVSEASPNSGGASNNPALLLRFGSSVSAGWDPGKMGRQIDVLNRPSGCHRRAGPPRVFHQHSPSVTTTTYDSDLMVTSTTVSSPEQKQRRQQEQDSLC